ncbi:hypothetical protein EFK50_11900 [Nocardioides marmoriginsengisoli]|uniref:Uncharacterized protein n=1 Tax=Nocardioides marmoriginsengisoli TaxID=661483 RepID=A0A3N0CGM9_9ACTN|nr:MaoC/PaaZ C-terminal domain-containing protein [Nocardioides marmoriginsengisoli]RNL62469.1 hypothetical protein EFK50_11900 [Nocardioides marmoriginsengisoli]
MTAENTVPDEAWRIDREMREVWERIPVAVELAPVSYTVTDEHVARYLTAVGGPPAPEGTAGWVPPELFCGDYSPLVLDFGQTVGFHASHRFTSYRPLEIGTTVTATGRVVEKFERRGFRYFTLSFTHASADGRVFVVNETTIAVGVLRDPSYRPEPRTGGPAEPRPEPVFETVATVPMSQEAMAVFAAQGAIRWGWEDTGGGAHTDESFAQSAGLEQTNAQSLHYVGWMARHLAARWGTAWWERGGLDVKFVGQVGPRDVLRLEASPGAGASDLLVRVLNDETGAVICTGSASLRAEAE